MQPYVVAVLINAVANPLGVGSSVRPPPLPPFTAALPVPLPAFFRSPSIETSPISLSFFNFISEQQSDYADPAESLFGITKARKNCRKCRKWRGGGGGGGGGGGSGRRDVRKRRWRASAFSFSPSQTASEEARPTAGQLGGKPSVIAKK